LAFALRQVAQLLLMCDRHDIGIAIGEGESPADQRWRSDDPSVEHALDEPRIFVYDNYPGGIGFSEPLYALHPDLLARTRELIASCACEHGCPTCVGPVGDTGPLAKAVALRVLDRLVAPMTSQIEVA
jgi:DEAD/DEAH box helicase domain-containing protein